MPIFFKRILLRLRFYHGGWKIILAGYIAVLFVFSIFGDQGLWRTYRLWKKTTDIEVHNQKLDAEIKQLSSQVYLFKNDLRTIEKYAREELNIAGRDEIRLVFK